MKKVDRTYKDYEDMLDMPRPISQKRQHMPIKDRAAQFAPFAAVVGHDAAVREAGRYTDQKKELDETEKAIIDETLWEVQARIADSPEVEITYFVADGKKSGGSYEIAVSSIKKIDVLQSEIILKDGLHISIQDIYSICFK